MSSMNGAALPCAAALLPAFAILEVAHVAGADVLAHHELVAHEVLEDDADAPAQHGGVPLLQVAAVEQDAPVGGLVEPRE